jgi:hypothetical protein
MADKRTLEQAFEAWRREPSEEEDHLATSVLFDLTCQALNEQEQRQAFDHLAACPACLQTLKQLMEPQQVVLTVPWPLAAAAPNDDEVNVEDEAQMVQCTAMPQGERTILMLQVQPAYRERLEHWYVQVLDAMQRELCSGQIVGGTLSRVISGRIAGELRLRLEQIIAPTEQLDEN